MLLQGRLRRAGGAAALVAVWLGGVLHPPAAAEGELLLAQAAGLSISQAGAATVLVDGAPAVFSTTTDASLAGDLPATTVTDTRLLGGGFSVTVAATAFVRAGDAGTTVPAGAARVFLDAPDLDVLASLLGLLVGVTVDGAVLADDAASLDTPYELLRARSGAGGGSLTFTPRIEVLVPAGTPAGTYTAVVTQTVS